MHVSVLKWGAKFLELVERGGMVMRESGMPENVLLRLVPGEALCIIRLSKAVLHALVN